MKKRGRETAWKIAMLVPLPPRRDCYRATHPEFLAFVMAYAELLVAAWDAREEEHPPRANPVALLDLYELGVGDSLLLWLVYQNHIEHLQATSFTDGAPEVQPVESILLRETSCFALTEAGEAFADEFLADALVPLEEGAQDAVWNFLILGQMVPCFDKEFRIFSWGQHVLKRFRQPSPNQEIVLAAAEELGWQDWFDDPLPRQPGTKSKVRCHDTIKDLNRRQTPYLVHFKGDGTGRRIGWEYR